MPDDKNDQGDTPPLLEERPPDEAPKKKRFGGTRSLGDIFKPLTRLAPSDFKALAATLCKVSLHLHGMYSDIGTIAEVITS
jgi:hypothetical protein